MNYKIVWSIRAQKKLKKTLNDVKDNWNIETAKKVNALIQDKVSLLATNKELCPISKRKGLRKCVISKQTSLIYRVKSSTIQIVTLLANKTNSGY